MVCGHEMNLCWSVQGRNPRQKGTVPSRLLSALTSSLLTANLIFWRNRVGGSLGALSSALVVAVLGPQVCPHLCPRL